MLRHGRTEWNEAGRIQGQTDVGLSESGRRQVAAWRVPARFLEFNWVASPLRRARETACVLGAREPVLEPRVREMSWGAWEGRTLAELRAGLGEQMTANERRGLDFRPPGGESPREVQARLSAWLGEVGGNGSATIAVTHKGVIRAMLALATGWDMTAAPPHRLDWDCAHLFSFEPRGGRMRALELNIELRGAR